MIRTLSGTVTELLSTGIILEVQGIGYLVTVPVRSRPILGSSHRFYTHHHIREQDQSLYGFLTLAELETFEFLLAVPSIGPKSALAILSIAEPPMIARAVESDNLSFFAAVPGIGKKSAAKIIVELKGKLGTSTAIGIPQDNELVEALSALGYATRDLDRVLSNLPVELTATQAQLTWVLQQLGRQP